MLKTICLIIPPSAFLLDERVFVHIGVLLLAAVMEREGCKVELLDLSGYANYMDIVRVHAVASTTKIFGITATTPQMPAAARIAQTIRAARPDARIILGGPHATLVYAAKKHEAKRSLYGRAFRAAEQLEALFDTIVTGDGEEAIFLACEENAPKVVDADLGRSSPLFLKDKQLNDLPFPAWHHIDVDSYHYTIDGVKALSVIGQRGCPFECAFCAGRSSPMLRHIRIRSVEHVIAEMIFLYRTYGCKGFMFYDDELNVNGKKFVALMNSITQVQKELGVEWKLRGFVKAELFTEEQAEAMYRAGFRWILVGFESGSERILKNINKKATVEDNTRCIETAHRHGLKVKALMSVGHSGESFETLCETRAWLLSARPDDLDITVITPYPGSSYHDDAVQSRHAESVWVFTCAGTGDKLYMEDVDYLQQADYYKGIPGSYVSRVWTDYLTQEDLVVERDRMEADVRRVLNIPFNQSATARQFEHSMGMTWLPPSILRTTA